MTKIEQRLQNIQAKIVRKGKCEWTQEEAEKNWNMVNLNLVTSTIIRHENPNSLIEVFHVSLLPLDVHVYIDYLL